MTTIQIRIDPKTKAKAKKVFNKMGLDMSSGIRLYLAHAARGKRYTSIDELMRDFFGSKK